MKSSQQAFVATDVNINLCFYSVIERSFRTYFGSQNRTNTVWPRLENSPRFLQCNLFPQSILPKYMQYSNYTGAI